MKDFYLTLPSNSSMELFPKNTLSDFYVQLPQTLELKGEWEVGLAEILFPLNFLNVRKTIDYRIRVYTDKTFYADLYIHEGFYEENQYPVDAIRPLLPTNKVIEISYSSLNRRVFFKIKRGAKLMLGRDIARMLGFGDAAILEQDTISPKQADVHYNFNSLFVYSDIVTPCPVGDVSAPLLRVVPITGTFGNMTSFIFSEPHYKPVSRKSIQTLQTYITDDAGEKLAFNTGRCIVVLHFRNEKS